VVMLAQHCDVLNILNVHLKMVKMVNVMLYISYHN